MRQGFAVILASALMLSLSACAGDNNPPVVSASPPARNEAPSATTIAWAGQTVTDALAAEKSARDGGKDETAIRHTINDAVNADAMAYTNKGAPVGQVAAGLRAALGDSRNTPATSQVFQMIEAGFEAVPTGGGHCTGCKD